MVWNMHGAGSTTFVNTLKELVRTHRPNVLVLVETHMGGAQATKIAYVLGYMGHTRVDAMGISGGIWVFWKPELVKVKPIIKHNQHITIDISRVGDTPWYFTTVYASLDPVKRKELWDDLKNFASTHNKPWLVASDFNDTRTTSERNTSCQETNRRSAHDWIDEMQLVEIEFVGAGHTWARGLSRETRQSGRLDQDLCNAEWGLRFEQAKVRHLPAVGSHHFPIFI
ncbi:uncharacterized protein [Spinacia oleracea]|uniref:Endonuclease/exonuclease/phosphatase domain-containing protein n=1 Tax=Spinacia oleracea TaxID=3562 RepID=A0A9R0JKG4_SPIOL|nr:uncharacterized protein LOC110777341 [Spinacia oleracea]